MQGTREREREREREESIVVRERDYEVLGCFQHLDSAVCVCVGHSLYECVSRLLSFALFLCPIVCVCGGDVPPLWVMWVCM